MDLVNHWLIDLMDHILVNLVDHWSVNLTHFVFVDYWLHMLVNNWLNVLMYNILVMFMNDILMMLMDDVSVRFLNYGRVNFCDNSGRDRVCLDYSTLGRSVDQTGFHMLNNHRLHDSLLLNHDRYLLLLYYSLLLHNMRVLHLHGDMCVRYGVTCGLRIHLDSL